MSSPAPVIDAPGVRVYAGDCVDVMRALPECGIDAVLTDPPYGIRVMGEAWDAPGIVERTGRGRATSPMPQGIGGPRGGYRSEATEAGRYAQTAAANRAFQDWVSLWAGECMRLLKPGGYLLAFGGSRTVHRLAAGIEDAGAEIRDGIVWLNGEGFPKSLDVARAVGAHLGDTAPMSSATTAASAQWQGWGTSLKPAFELCVVARKPLAGTVAENVLSHGTGAMHIDACRIQQPGESDAGPGRWPTNVLLAEEAARALDYGAPESVSRRGKPRASKRPGDGWGMTFTGAEYDDRGGPSRFFPVCRYARKASSSERPTVGGVAHPTVKPLDLMRWLVRLVARRGATVLDPFAGSGTTLEACVIEGMDAIGIEKEESYMPLIEARLGKPVMQTLDLGGIA
ncbi:MAG: site-specific DNA-methyltransferase [Schaalia georgiae]|uniref:Site-specific DNA-methyltransferase n=1 Tax=Schaalia georgiae TaxID=52768 RepID=A0A929MXJ3_9ACTO|nr:site-specific DNA-methyltransferase [Schaalia georgiae]